MSPVPRWRTFVRERHTHAPDAATSATPTATSHSLSYTKVDMGSATPTATKPRRFHPAQIAQLLTIVGQLSQSCSDGDPSVRSSLVLTRQGVGATLAQSNIAVESGDCRWGTRARAEIVIGYIGDGVTSCAEVEGHWRGGCGFSPESYPFSSLRRAAVRLSNRQPRPVQRLALRPYRPRSQHSRLKSRGRPTRQAQQPLRSPR